LELKTLIAPPVSKSRLTSATLVLVANETCPDPQVVLRFVERLRSWFIDVEVAVVASDVGPDVALELKRLSDEVPDSLVVFLSEPVHQDIARLIGIDHAVSDFIIFATPTLDEERALEQMIVHVEGGADLVTAKSLGRDRQSLLQKLLVRTFGLFVRKASGTDFEERPAMLRILSRAAALYLVSRREGEVLVRAPSLGSAFPSVETAM
jgi:hypothetical protein